MLGFVLFGGLALRLLAIGAQVLDLGALGLGVVVAHLMGVVALGGIRFVCRRHPIAAAGSFSNYLFVTNPTQIERRSHHWPYGLGWQRWERYRPALPGAMFGIVLKIKKI